MRLSLTDEQSLIQSSALDWLADRYGFRQREAGLYRDGGSPEAWSAFADMGWLGLPLPEDDGGLGMGSLETGLLMQAFGRHLVVEPWHACVAQAGRLLALTGTSVQRSEWLTALVAGQLRLALAHVEPGDRLPWEARRTRATRSARGWRLVGEKRQVVGAPGSACWVVTASVDEGTRLFLVDPRSSGIRLDAYDTLPGGRAADIRFDGADAVPLGEGHASLAVASLNQVLAEGIIAHGWEATGAMQAALAQTTDYTQQRKQFGQSLSQFQVVQHRLAEMAVHCAEAQAVCELASMRLALAPANGIDLAALVKNKVGRSARFVAQEAVQLHGAMGVCEELPVAATFRALLAFAQQGGAADQHARSRGFSQLETRAYAHSQTLDPAVVA